MRTLLEIRNDFEDKADDRKLLDLMNELEKDYGTFCLNPSKDFLNRPEVKLYREISLNRNSM